MPTRFISHNYCEGDEIFLFGFSRGAYTARRVGGLIGYAGLIGKGDLDRFSSCGTPTRTGRRRARDLRVRHQNVADQMHRRVGHRRSGRHSGGLREVRFRLQAVLRISDTGLGAHVEHAFHALALDERRKNFVPTLWTQTAAGKAKGQELKQVWFAGVHSVVGGGYGEHGMSDITLAWMAARSRPTRPRLRLPEIPARLVGQMGLGQVHESSEGDWTKLGDERRSPFAARSQRIGRGNSYERRGAHQGHRRSGGGPSARSQGWRRRRNSAALSPLETGLQWERRRVKSSRRRRQRKPCSFREKFMKASAAADHSSQIFLRAAGRSRCSPRGS